MPRPREFVATVRVRLIADSAADCARVLEEFLPKIADPGAAVREGKPFECLLCSLQTNPTLAQQIADLDRGVNPHA